MFNYFQFLLIWLLLLTAPLTFGADKFVGLNLNLSAQQKVTDDGTEQIDTTETAWSFNGGIYIIGGLIAGLVHYQDVEGKATSTDQSTTVTTTVTTSSTLSGTGLYGGYHADNGFVGQAGYLLLDPKFKTSGRQLYGGAGILAQLGYRFEFGDFGIGGMLEYYEFTFKKEKLNSVESDLSEDLKWKGYKPVVSTYLFF